MGKVWILDTETKGTGANMVPLDRVLRKPGSDAVPGFSFPKLKRLEPAEPEPREPRRFKVVDVQTREVLVQDADARTTIGVLEPVRSIVDVNVWVWQPERERWRMLSLDELRALWEYRGRLQDEPLAASA
ncbi:MAG TPA: hypothetical protein VMF57_21285 [Solirubrobacteraceae bacterium]|nr:hypothetical protein [Solirubrobacteraceae bacterium]